MLKFTGFGAAYQPELGSNSAYFIVNKHLYIIDAGESVFLRMKERFGLFEEFKNVIFILTHMHADHTGSLASFISYLKNIAQIKPTIIYPQTTITALLSLMGIDNQSYQHIPSNTYKDSNIQLEFIQTPHVSKLTCFGCRLTSQNKTIYYSGDSNELPIAILTAFKNHEIDCWYQDVTTDPNNTSHLYYKDLLKNIPQHLHSKIYCMHLEKSDQSILNQHQLQIVEPAD